MAVLLPLLTIALSFLSVHCDVIEEVHRIYIQGAGFPGAENVAVDIANQHLFTANGFNLSVDVLDYTSSLMISSISFQPLFDEDHAEENVTVHDVTTVALHPAGYAIAGVVPKNYSFTAGWLAFIDATTFEVVEMMKLDGCYLPDHVTVSPDGSKLIVVCEGEPSNNEVEYPEFNPAGKVAVVDVSSSDMADWHFTLAGFEAFDDNTALLNELYLSHQNESFSVNAEPEYSAVSDDGKYAYITLQENNAIAVLDVDAIEIIAIFPLGYANFSHVGLDASDKDDMINIETYPNLRGLRSPDSIDYMLSEAGRHYLFTANEGDSKDFDEVRVKDVVLSSNTTFAGYDVEELQQNEHLGRLKVSNLYGQNEDGHFETLYTFSSRDFTVWEVIMDTQSGVPSSLELVYSSENLFELITAQYLREFGFNSNYHSPSFDDRSDAKGPEPESIVTGKCNNGRVFAFIGMERAGGIFVFDVTLLDQGTASYVQYHHSQNFSVIFEEDTRPPPEAGNIGPEQLVFVPEDESDDPEGRPYLVAAYPESSSVVMYTVNCEAELADSISTTQDVIISTTEYEHDDTEQSKSTEAKSPARQLQISILSVYTSIILSFISFR